jgi:hypothetical protein
MTDLAARNATILDRYRAGDCVRAIAADAGVSRQRVWGLAHAAGLRRDAAARGAPRGPHRIDAALYDEVEAMLAMGTSQRTIRRQLGVTDKLVRHVRDGRAEPLSLARTPPAYLPPQTRHVLDLIAEAGTCGAADLADWTSAPVQNIHASIRELSRSGYIASAGLVRPGARALLWAVTADGEGARAVELDAVGRRRWILAQRDQVTPQRVHPDLVRLLAAMGDGGWTVAALAEVVGLSSRMVSRRLGAVVTGGGYVERQLGAHPRAPATWTVTARGRALVDAQGAA